MPNVLAVILSYCPDESIVDNVNALLSQVEHIVIVDNDSSEASRRLLQAFPETKVNVIANQSNNGVAIGFNQGVRWGLERNFEYFLLMDQDSKASSDMVKELQSVLMQFQNGNPLILVGPNHDSFTDSTSHTPVVSTQVSLLITSGSFFSKRLVETIGFYDERLFIDHVDHDFCLRLYRAGGVCIKVASAKLNHKFGAAKVKTFLGKSFFLQEYSPTRRYHMMRNRIVLYKRYGMFVEKWFWLDLRSAIKDLIKLLFFESEKQLKLVALSRGLIDGLKWKD